MSVKTVCSPPSEPVIAKVAERPESLCAVQGVETEPDRDIAADTPVRPASDGISTGRRIIKNFLCLTGANFACKALSFASTAYLARILGTEGFGILGFSQAVLVYFQLLTNQGLDTFGTREIARRPSETGRYVNNIVSIRLILTAAAYGLLILFAALIPKPAVIKAAILILGLKLFEMTFNLKWVFQGRERMEWIAISRIIQQMLFVAGVFLLIHRPGQVLRVPWLTVGTAAAGALMLFVLYRRMGGSLQLGIDLPFWKEIFRQSIPMATSYFLIQVYLNFDMILLGFMHGEHTVGLYSAAYKMITLINLFGIYYFMTIFPNISRLYPESCDKLLSLLSQSVRYVAMIAVPLGIGGTILAGPIVGFVFGNDFASSATPFRIIIWNVAIIWISLHYGNTLIACNRQKRYLAGVAIGAVSNIILNIIFIPRFGMTAAALTTIFAEIAVLWFMYRELRKVIPLGFLGTLVRPLVASTGMGSILLLLPEWNVFAMISIGVVVYFPLLFITGGIARGDLERFRTLFYRSKQWRKGS